ncbi:peptidyl-prolyl cis-trans isomerase [Massilia forsythiae]|uniref:peptidyl-prolyl cis-trans isomerase n=1 Tax=Massilia forsythiae TaxID=2728020 RepID=UPI001E5DEDD1|nr:peptidyl-prolyl cis-trans isomerase [Massilia forsythiae]
MARPTPGEVEEYFNKHPELFANRKQFSMNELVIAAADLTPDLRNAADGARSLEEVAVWLDAHKIKYGRNQVTRSTTDVPPAMASRLLGMPKGQLFVVKDGARAMFIAVADVKEAPVGLPVAGAQIEQFLMKKKNQELASAELQRLRGNARIEYLNKSLAPDAKAGAPAGAGAAAGAPAGAAAGAEAGVGSPSAAAALPAVSDSVADKAALDRGVAGLK